MFSMENRVVLVTGGSRGIGRAIALKVVEHGGQAIIHYGARHDAAEETASLAGKDRCLILQSDLAEPGAASDLWQEAASWQGHVDVLVNNAGIFPGVHISETDEAWRNNWHETLQVNLVAAADLCRCAVIQWLQDSHAGIIVNISSRAAARGDDADHWAYAASKGGMESLTKTIARAYAANGISAYNVAPGFVDTVMAREAFMRDPQLMETALAAIPMGGFAPAVEIANTVCFLAAGLATHASGATIDINGASHVR